MEYTPRRPRSSDQDRRGDFFIPLKYLAHQSPLSPRLTWSRSLPSSFFDIALPTNNGYVIDEVRGVHFALHPQGATPEGLMAKALVTSKAILAERRRSSRLLIWTAFGIVISACAYAGYRMARRTT